jgi:hypothetical protein
VTKIITTDESPPGAAEAGAFRSPAAGPCDLRSKSAEEVRKDPEFLRIQRKIFGRYRRVFEVLARM